MLRHGDHLDDVLPCVLKSRIYIGTLFGDSRDGETYKDSIDKLLPCMESTQEIVGILVGLKEAYENEFLFRLHEWIVADISADYVAQAELLLVDQNVGSDGYGRHVPAAVICSAVLEDSLRCLCARQSPPIDATKANGHPMRLNSLIDELQNAGLYNPMKGDHLRSWAKTRNHAAHGEYTEFSRQDVDSMLRDVKVFLHDYL